MKTTILMIPFIALGAMGMKADKTTMVPTLKTVSIQMQDDALMAATKKMMQEMHAQPMKGNVDLDFAAMLKIHHQGAIDMAKTELQQGKDATMKAMAQNIIDKQTKEIGELTQLITSLQSAPKNYDPANKEIGAGKAMSENMMAMMKMGKMSMSSLDHEFADMMVKHHKDGIMMAKSILTHAKNEKLRSMAQKSIPEQTSDISKMEQWMKSHK